MVNIDERMTLIGELFGAIRTIKLFAWEEYFQKKLHEKRKLELKNLRVHIYFQAASFLVNFFFPDFDILVFQTYLIYLIFNY